MNFKLKCFRSTCNRTLRGFVFVDSSIHINPFLFPVSILPADRLDCRKKHILNDARKKITHKYLILILVIILTITLANAETSDVHHE
jgi:hypothetical protein